ncbi:hypothetical protein BDN70DRAFT_481306 [Pholiota conissans]|uniref:Heterokaryon incompatibility domain-containing protein n=1 Tax=Pholiota conissans TaxID=109636 RepID=A0A9P5Z6U9_9AGAR|nr:hypothetical protein BDN70DRAFT_481306 [Pholiota conissans]
MGQSSKSSTGDSYINRGPQVLPKSFEAIPTYWYDLKRSLTAPLSRFLQSGNSRAPKGIQQDDQMTSRDTPSQTGGDGGLLGSTRSPDRSHATLLSTQAQLLLRALHCFIMPLVHIGGGDDRNLMENAGELPFGPEGQEFVAALLKFVSSVVLSQLSYQNNIEVELASESSSPVIESDEIIDDSRTPPARPRRLPERIEDAEDGNDDSVISTLVPQPTRTEKVLAALRNHVFNKMPIRLLFFRPHRSKLQITLLERAEIYAFLAPQLQSEFDETQFLADIEANVKPWMTEAEAEAEAIEGCVSKYTQYAILSHTWIREASGEITYSEWRKGELDFGHLGYQKLVKFCRTSWENHGVHLGWMDTVCINKDSSTELDESIRSMYKWYRESHICVTYLAETASLTDMHKDPWFTRGWTLQELVASTRIKFYGSSWKPLANSSIYNDAWDAELQNQIELATTITEYELRDITSTSISRRMQLAAKRKVTREEDIAYSLMGIFDVSISIAYGEGAERAFFRLIKELLSSYRNVFDIFNWACDIPSPWSAISSLLPSSPQHYLYRYAYMQVDSMRPIEPLTLTHLGLRIPILLMPAISLDDLNASHAPIGDYYATVDITPIKFWEDELRARTYTLLDKRISGPDGRNPLGGFQMTFGILNFGGDENSIQIAKTCHAVGLSCQEDAGSVTTLGPVTKIDTQVPIVFELFSKDAVEEVGADEYQDYYRVPRNQLARHGMQLVTLYL